jgi:hypothetical protein
VREPKFTEKVALLSLYEIREALGASVSIVLVLQLVVVMVFCVSSLSSTLELHIKFNLHLLYLSIAYGAFD